MSTIIRIADILKAAFPEYLRRYGPLPPQHYRAVNAIINCRTETLGYHAYCCSSCNESQIHFHSCRNRHCPRCQGYASMQWVQARVGEMLPVSYFHAVFTIPAELNPFALRNKNTIYSILYRAVNDTLQQLAGQRKWLGAQIGCIAVLHTWGQTLADHPHLHCIIPAGGLQSTVGRWKHCRNNFLFPVPVIQKIYRGKFMEYFKDAIEKGDIQFHGKLKELQPQQIFNPLLDALYRKDWVVYIKPSFASPEAVLNYLGRYSHRVAISEKRILKFENGKVTFGYTDYANGNQRKTMTLSAVEFIRRFLLHVLPHRFMRIRHFGIFANRGRTARIALCRKLLGIQAQAQKVSMLWWESVLERTGIHPLLCPECGNGILELVMVISPRRRWLN